jgi:protein SCO1
MRRLVWLVAALLAFGQPADSAEIRLVDRLLVDQHGVARPFAADVIGDHDVIIAAVYTGCTTLCPITTSIFQSLQTELAARNGKPVRLVSISLDPLTDTPEVLAAAAADAGAGPDWLWLTGAKRSIDEVLVGLGAYSSRPEDHLPLFIIGSGAARTFVKLYGFPSVAEIVDVLATPDAGD